MLVSSSIQSTGFDQELVYDWEEDNIWFDTLGAESTTAESVIVSNVELDWHVSSVGVIYQKNGAAATNDDGIDISWKAQMAPNDIGAQGRSKHFHILRTYLRQKVGSQTIRLSISLDEGRQAPVTGTLAGGSTQVYNSGLKYNTGLIYEGGSNQVLEFWVNRLAETIAPRWEGTDPVEIVGYDVDYKVVQ
jgi:hypothetical protein